MYKIGFIYHLPFSGDYRTKDGIVLCLTDEGFRFFLIGLNLIPSKYKGSNSSNYDFSKPVLCEVSENRVHDIKFFIDFPIIDDADKCTGFSFLVKKSEYSSTLLYNKEPFVNILGKEKKLIQIITNIVVAKKQMSSLSEVAYYISPNSLEEEKKKVVRNFKKHIDSFDMNKILSSLYVNVWDHLRTKIGDDDTYSIFREAKLLDESIIIDDYIKKIIGLGKECIYKDSGYTNQLERYAEGFLEIHPLGVYSGETLEREKQRILSMYTKEEHMAFLFYEQLFKQQKCSQEIAQWRRTLNNAEEELNKDALIQKIALIENRFFDAFQLQDNPLGFLACMNKYLYRIQHLPPIKVIITGNTPIINSNDQYGYDLNTGLPRYQSRCYLKIGDVIENMAKTYNVIIICGNIEDVEVEHLSLKYALQNKIPFIRPNFNRTMSRVDKAYEMAKMADLIVLTGDPNCCIAKDFSSVAEKLNIPIKLI